MDLIELKKAVHIVSLHNPRAKGLDGLPLERSCKC